MGVEVVMGQTGQCSAYNPGLGFRTGPSPGAPAA